MLGNLRAWLGLPSGRPTRPPSVGAAPGGAVPSGNGALAGLTYVIQGTGPAYASGFGSIYASATGGPAGDWALTTIRTPSPDPIVREFFDQYEDDADRA